MIHSVIYDINLSKISMQSNNRIQYKIQSNMIASNEHKNKQSVLTSQYNSDTDIVSQYAQIYLQLQQYHLKSNLWQCKMPQHEYQSQRKQQLNRVQMKYKQIENKLQQMVNQLKTQLMIAQANQLRSINNVLTGYLKRVGIVRNNMNMDNDCNKQIELQQQWVMQQLILDPFNHQPQSIQRIHSISLLIESLTQSLQKNQSPIILNKAQQQHLPQSSQSSSSTTKQLFQILNSTQIHLFNQYQLFQNNFINVNRLAQEGFQMLNGYLNKLEEMATRRVCLEIKTMEELQIEQIIRQSERKQQQQQSFTHIDQSNSNNNRAYFGFNNKTITKKPKRKDKLKHINLGRMFNKKKGRQSISHHITNNYNKRQLTLLTQSLLSQDGQHIPIPDQLLHSITDNQLKQFYKCDKLLRQRYEECPDSQLFKQNYYYRDYKNDDQWKKIIGYEYNNGDYGRRVNKFNTSGNQWRYEDYSCERYQQRCNSEYLQPEFLSIEQILQRTYPSISDIHSIYNYDPYGTNGNFSLIHPLSNMLQQRIVFESTHETIVHRTIKSILMIASQTKKKAEKYIMEKERKQVESKLVQEDYEKKNGKNGNKDWKSNRKGLFSQLDNQQQNTYSNKPNSNNKLIADLLNNTNNIQLQSQKNNQHQEPLNGNTKQSKTEENQLKDEQSKTQNHKIDSENVCKQGQSTTLQQVGNSQTMKLKSQEIAVEVSPLIQNKPLKQPLTLPTHAITLLSSLIQSYFSTVQQKYSRMKKEQKSIKVFYSPSLQETPWQYLHQQIDTIERVFIVIQSPQIMLIKMERFYTLEKELIKSVVYEFGVVEMRDNDRDVLRNNVKERLYKNEVVTFMFKHISEQPLQQQVQTHNQQVKTSNLPCSHLISTRCLLGMLFVLIYQQKIQKDSVYTLIDYHRKGQQLIDQFQSFYHQVADCSDIQTYTNPQLLFKRVYQNPNVSKINYFFQQQTDQGVVFSKLVDVVGKNLQGQQEVEVFRVKRVRGEGNMGEIQQEVQEEDKGQKQHLNAIDNNIHIDDEMKQHRTQKEDTPAEIINNPPQKGQTNQGIAYSYFNNDISLKRSSSRQQLRHVIYQSDMFVASTYGQYDNSSKNNQQTEMSNNYFNNIQGHPQQQLTGMGDEDYYQGQFYDDEEEQQYLGLE